MRKQELKKKAREIVDQGRTPSVKLLSRELEYAEPDVHRLLNSLEKEGEVETYTKDMFGTRHRMVGLKR